MSAGTPRRTDDAPGLVAEEGVNEGSAEATAESPRTDSAPGSGSDSGHDSGSGDGLADRGSSHALDPEQAGLEYDYDGAITAPAGDEPPEGQSGQDNGLM